jgi:uncharacterized oligopeptide transporter (OPT) family protein
MTATALYEFFGLAFWQPMIAILISAPLAYLAVRSVPLLFILILTIDRCSGETDINPISAVAKVTQLLFAGIAPHNLVTNLMSAAVAGAGSSQAGDMCQDFKTGFAV